VCVYTHCHTEGAQVCAPRRRREGAQVCASTHTVTQREHKSVLLQCVYKNPAVCVNKNPAHDKSPSPALGEGAMAMAIVLK
jgi:hypothetical protein